MKLYYDLASPYAYLAVARAADVLGEQPELQPVLVGAIFGWRGRGSWALTDARDAGEAEVERRAAPLRAAAGRVAARVAGQRPRRRCGPRCGRTAQGRGPEFARAAFEREFARGEDISDVALLDEIARSVGLEGVREAIADPEVKRALKEATEAAWALGVQGVPTLEAGRRLYFGDDRLEEASSAR